MAQLRPHSPANKIARGTGNIPGLGCCRRNCSASGVTRLDVNATTGWVPSVVIKHGWQTWRFIAGKINYKWEFELDTSVNGELSIAFLDYLRVVHILKNVQKGVRKSSADNPFLICIYDFGLYNIICYQHMPRGAVTAPLREEVSKWRPFISKVFLNLFWDIHFIFVIWGHGGNAFEIFFGTPKMARVKRVICVSGGCARGAKTQPP